MLAIASPGQGAQKPGFLSPWLEIESVAELIGSLGENAGIDLVEHGTNSDADTIRDTAIAQPLLVAASLAVHHALYADADLARPDFYTGHSVGEVPAAALAGVLSNEDAMRFVQKRSQAMAHAAAEVETGMIAIVGGDRGEVLQAIEAAGATAANINGSAQVVAAGSTAQLAALQEQPPAKARLIPLQVAGAFHSPFMESARAALTESVQGLATNDAHTLLVTNAAGEVVSDGGTVLASLISQVANTVDWLLCMRTLEARGVSGVIELAPAGTLTGLLKRDAKSISRFDLNTPDQLDAAREFVREHAGRATEEA